MAVSPQHAFGQIIGNLLEAAIYPALKDVADEFGLFLDQKKPRAARRGKAKVSWVDGRNNSHDLDYVLEQGGSETVIGKPKAFIEIAWRRYTKHSKNKAQEIEGAVGHLRLRYHESSPFLGAILAGDFTAPSLTQLTSHGFTILYFPYASVIKAFASEGINAAFDEKTSDEDVEKKVDAYKALTEPQTVAIAEKLISLEQAGVDNFITSLKVSLSRKLEAIYIIPLHGNGTELGTVDDAINFIQGYDEDGAASSFSRYEIIVRFSNAVRINGEFPSKQEAIEFLRRMM